MRYPLVEIGGNGGSILGDSAAAMRYTECRLTPIGELMLEDLSEDSVQFKPNYDETTREPLTLPSKFPNILCNGNSGIAVGLSSNLVPHNLNEVVDGIIAYIQNPKITISELMKHIPGPDFPTGGVIVDSEKLEDIYTFGSGAVTLQGKYEIEKIGVKQAIHFTEVPYLIDVEEGIIKKLKKLVVEDGFDLIEEYENNTNKNGISLRIFLKKGANVYKVLETLWKETRLQVSQRISNTVIVGGMPKVLDLKEMIKYYVEYRNEVILNIAKAKYNKVLDRIEVVDALLKAIQDIDRIIDLIKKSNSRADAKVKLLKEFTERQANAILDMKLSSLSKLDNEDLSSEWRQLQEKRKYYEKLISNESLRNQEIVKELKEIKAKYGDARKTKLGNKSTAAIKLSTEPINILVYENGKVYTTQKKVDKIDFGKKASPLNETYVKSVVSSKPSEILSIFTKDGTMTNYNMLTFTIDELESLGIGEVTAAIDLANCGKESLVFVTKDGLVKKTKIDEYLKAKTTTKSIRIKDGDSLLYVGAANDNDFIYILGEKGKLSKFAVSEITSTSKITVGSKGINDAAIDALVAAKGEKIFSINKEGQAKLSNEDDYNLTAKGGNGQVIADDIISILGANKGFVVVFDGKKNVVVSLTGMAVKSKTSIGAKIISGAPLGLGN